MGCVKPLLGYADVKNAWSFTSSPFIRFYSMTISKDMVFRLKNNYNSVSVATYVKRILCCAGLIQPNSVLFLGFPINVFLRLSVVELCGIMERRVLENTNMAVVRNAEV
jgi:hypothetical protein